jgi:hypothetical protein
VALDPLVERLQQCLYQNCFCARFSVGLEPEPRPAPEATDLKLSLAGANPTSDRWEAGWFIESLLPDGVVSAQKHGKRRSFWPGEFVTYSRPAMRPAEGTEISVFFPRESHVMQRGWYFAFGESVWEDRDDLGILRIYWNIRSAGVERLVRAIAVEFNRFQVPFRLKCLTSRAHYFRLDSAVLYFNSRCFHLAVELVANIRTAVASYMGSSTPLFAKHLAPGLAFAEDPNNGESFGGNRCRILAEGIRNGYLQGARTSAQRLEIVINHMGASGVPIERPYMSATSPGYETSAFDAPQVTTERTALAASHCEIFLNTAERIGARLCRDALWAANRANWLGDFCEFVANRWQVVHRACGPELYNGTSGIALFLAELFSSCGESPYRSTAEAAILSALTQAEDVSRLTRISFFSGRVGIAYSAIRVGELLNQSRFVSQGLAMMEDLRGEDLSMQEIDLLTGCAGAIAPLLAVYRRYPRDCFLDLAMRCGQRLMEAARSSDQGCSWRPIGGKDRERGWTGFSHGAAGNASALLELWLLSGDPRFRVTALEAFRYEHSWFRADLGNWQDLRPSYEHNRGDHAEPRYTAAWCHGAPGIALSRLRAWQVCGGQELKAEACVALNSTATTLEKFLSGGAGNFSLCHGIAGNAEVLCYGDSVLGTGHYRSLLESAAHRGIERFERAGAPWPCGVPEEGETPVLMLGLAGIGRFYLRLAGTEHLDWLLIIIPEKVQLPFSASTSARP